MNMAELTKDRVKLFRSVVDTYCWIQDAVPSDECRRRTHLVREVSGHPEIIDAYEVQYFTGTEWIELARADSFDEAIDVIKVATRDLLKEDEKGRRF